MPILIDDKASPSWGGTTEFLNSELAHAVVRSFVRHPDNWLAPAGKEGAIVFVDFDDTLALNTEPGVDSFAANPRVAPNTPLIRLLDSDHSDRWFVLTARGMHSNNNLPAWTWQERALKIQSEIGKFLVKYTENRSEPIVGVKAYSERYTDEYVATPEQVTFYASVWLVARANNSLAMKLAWQLYRLGLIICP